MNRYEPNASSIPLHKVYVPLSRTRVVSSVSPPCVAGALHVCVGAGAVLVRLCALAALLQTEARQARHAVRAERIDAQSTPRPIMIHQKHSSSHVKIHCGSSPCSILGVYPSGAGAPRECDRAADDSNRRYEEHRDES